MATPKSTLALHGGEPVHRGQWPSWPVHDEREREALLAVLDSGKWWYGERVAEFEAAFAAFQDARFGVTCCNGTVALELALLGAGVGTGHEVLVPPYTFIATATAVLKANAVPVFVDVEPDTLNLDPAQLEAAVTERTAAVVPVHFAGLPADMDAINAVARRHGLRSHLEPTSPLEDTRVEGDLRAVGFDVIVSIGEVEENLIGSNCGQFLRARLAAREGLDGGYTYPVEAYAGAGEGGGGEDGPPGEPK